MADPEWCDVKAAGWWVWGISAWIGGGFGEREIGARLPSSNGEKVGCGVHQGAKLPRLSGDRVGSGIHGLGIAPLASIAARLRKVRVACGSWDRVMGPSVLAHDRVFSVGVVLDPPYDDGAKVYAHNNRMSADVRAWCVAHGHIPTLRIVLCGYEGEHDELEVLGWDKVAWKAAGGYGSQGAGAARENATRERIWFSPHCLRAAQESMF
jgi:hypothetical protein